MQLWAHRTTVRGELPAAESSCFLGQHSSREPGRTRTATRHTRVSCIYIVLEGVGQIT